MRIDNITPVFYTQLPVSHEQYPAAPQQTDASSRPGIVVDISPEGWAAYNRSQAEDKAGAAGKIPAIKECQTCKNRRYQDSSDDSSVSFQTPTHISPEQSASMVMAHESEHVSHEQAKADKEGRRVISQTVTLETSICPECGRVYVSGGVTKTVTAKDASKDNDMAPSE
jgi:ribosomal protein L32